MQHAAPLQPSPSLAAPHACTAPRPHAVRDGERRRDARTPAPRRGSATRTYYVRTAVRTANCTVCGRLIKMATIRRRTAVLSHHLQPEPPVAAASTSTSANWQPVAAVEKAPPLCPRVEMAPGGPMVSEVICGAMRFTSGTASYTPEQALKVVKELLAIGVTTFDVAAVYGGGEHVRAVEHLLGAALSLEPGLREQIEIVTKCGITTDGDQALYDTTTAHILASAEKSLAALQTDFIDVLLIHRPDPLMDADEAAAAFLQLKAEGKVRFFGVSNFSPSQVELLQSRLGNQITLVTNQVEISCIETKLLSQPFGDGTLDQCQLARQRPMAWSPLNKLMQGERTEQVKRVLDSITEIAAELGLSDPQGDAAVTAVAVAWLKALPSKPLIVTGSTKPERIRQAVTGLSVPLTRTQWFAILQASRGAGVP